jgi:hypothetical protein
MSLWHTLGEAAGCNVYRSGKRGVKEYIVDLCWVFEPEEGVGWIQLGLESEWNMSYDAWLEDFSKLLDLKSYEKVFIFRCLDGEQDQAFGDLAQEIALTGIKIPGETYLLIAHSWKDDENGFVSGAIVDNLGIIQCDLTQTPLS